MSLSMKLFASDSTSIEDPTLYRSVLGSLQYLSVTRPPDLAFSVNWVCQYMHAPRLSHWQAIKCILWCLKHTMEHGLTLTQSFSSILVVFSYAN